MWCTKSGVKLYVSPTAAFVLVVFIFLSTPLMLCAVGQASLLHELGHWLTLRAKGAKLSGLRITAFGAEMLVDSRCRLSYGAEFASVAAGPAVNLLFAMLFGGAGQMLNSDVLYLFAGTHLVLGLFNLLPAYALDGGRILWLAIAYLAQPFAADRVCAVANGCTAAMLLGCGVFVLLRGGHFFLLLAAVGLCVKPVADLGLVKRVRAG